MQLPGGDDAMLGDEFRVGHKTQLVFGKSLVVQTAARKHVILTKEATAARAPS